MKSTLLILLIPLIILISFSIVYRKNCESFNVENDWMSKFFDRVYVITIPGRLNNVNRMLKNLKIKGNIHNAVLKNDLNINQLINKRQITYDNELNTGRIACHLSHMQVLKKFLETNDKTCLIFEDDIDLESLTSDYYYEKITNFMKDVPKDWDILNMGMCWERCSLTTYITENVSRGFEPLCRHSYAVTRKGAEIILKNALPMPNKNGDKIIGSLIKNGMLICYTATPPIFKQNRDLFGSQLENYDELLPCKENEY